EQTSRRAGALARTRQDPVAEAEALKFAGMAARERGRFEEAEHALSEANALAVEVEDRLLEAQVARELGEVLRRSGRVAEGRAELTRALALFTGMGATLERQDVENRLSRLGSAARGWA
ncbi:MAG: hypothetical protein ACRENP_23245, partial [Longimicrobiales bacterium]